MAPPEPKERNSVRPAVTTSARWDFLERSATLIASSRRPSLRAPATLGANSRDCLRAAEKYSARSMMTASDQMDMMNSTTTTARARPPMLPHSCMGLKPTAGAPASWKNMAREAAGAWARVAM
jgi:hypothetical protein